MTFRHAAPIVFLAALALTEAPAQSMRPVSGLVTDKRGNTLPGSFIQLENTVTLDVSSRIADGKGYYLFSAVSGEVDYTLRARYRKYWSRPVTISKFNEAKRIEVNLVIPID